MSNIINKIKDAMHSDSHSSNTHSGAPEGTHGPHSSRVANAADPRVDSDRDGSNTMGNRRTAGHGETGSSNPFTSSGTTGTHNTFGSSGTSEGTHGPHSSRIANAVDPRVDSDLDGSNTMGNTMGRSTGTHGIGGTTGGLGGNTFGSGNTHHAHAGTGMTGMSGTHGAPAGTYGPHSSRMANAADPRVDSDRDGRSAIGTGPGPAPNTAGPHKSDMMNKVDPRIDSDLDGSKTMGGNKTYQ